MTTLRHPQIACAILVGILGRLLLQQPDDIPGILQPEKISKCVAYGSVAGPCCAAGSARDRALRQRFADH
jgi:hypothetical protein